MILVENPAASDTPYYTPSQCPVAGTAVAGRVEAPKLFKPFQIGRLKLQNRILRGGSVNGYAKEVSVPVHGWPENVFAPSARPSKDNSIVPRDMTQKDIFDLVDAWISAAIEIHAGHGYLLHEFLSPVSNRRYDSYGGSFENRIRLLLEITRATKANIPSSVPLFVRVSGTDWLEYLKHEPSWNVPQTIELAKILADEGVDVLDVSSGGNDPRHKIESGPGYQAPFALAVKRALGDRLLVATVGSITSGGQANALLDQGLDMVMIGRTFLKNPGLVWAFAEDLKVEATMPKQIRWAFGSH
ncbi:hypothetical protein D6D06_06783 [Aureobasidium pullulans]|nr:hypothetical protein D6D06_06783 [Aureobasidium pullulans]